MRATWDERIARAGVLASSDLMRFYLALLREQQTWCDPAAFPRLLDFVERSASAELAERARVLRAEGLERWEALVQDYWLGCGRAEDEFFARAFLEPQTEIMYPDSVAPVPDTNTRCPCCERRPVVSVLRQEYDGARRSLVCSLCHWEWKFRRILCPECREQEFDSLPVYHVESLPHLRIETCESCKNYLLCVDITREPQAVPIVDDIAAVPVHLWAREQGYIRVQTNLLGL